MPYSSAATYGLFYKDANMAIAKHGKDNVNVFTKPAVTIPDTVTGDLVEEIKNNTALDGYTPENLPEGVELEIELVDVGETIVYDVTPMANGVKVDPTEAITFRLPVPGSETAGFAKIYHEGTLMGIYEIQGEGNAKYVEISSKDFSEFGVEPITPTVEVDRVKYETFEEAIPNIKKNSYIKLLADIEYGKKVDGTPGVQFKLPQAGGTITIDLNGHDLTFHYTMTIQFGTQVTVIDTSDGEKGTLRHTRTANPIVIAQSSYLNVVGVHFDGAVQLTAQPDQSDYFMINNEKIIGMNCNDALFITNVTVRVKTDNNLSVLNFSMGTVTLTTDFAISEGQNITIGGDCGLVIPEGVTLTLNEGATLTNNGVVNGDGTIKVATLDQLKVALASDIKNIEVTGVINAGDDEVVDLNGKTLTGTVLGTVEINGGLWITAEGLKLIGTGAEYYTTTNAVVNVSATELTLISGKVSLAQSWRTLPGQNITVDTNAIFVVPENMTFTIYDNTSVVVNGTLVVDGTIVLMRGATLTAPENLNVTTDVEYGKVLYKDGKYYVLVGLLGSGTEADPYQIGSVKDLIFFRNSVNAGETKYNAEGVYVVLTDDIDLASVENWAPIGTFDYSFDSNFNGQGHKIMNLKISDNTPANGEAYLGFFGVTANNTIENFTIENVTINSNGQIVAAAIAYPYYTTVKDITVCGDIAIKGGNYTAGVLAYTRLCLNASNLAVSGNEGSYITGANVVGGVIADIQMNKGLVANYSNFKASNVTITGNKCVGGIAGIIATQTLDGATVENVTLTCSDARVGIVAGSFGGVSTIKNISTSNVTGATAIIGATYDGGVAVQAVVNNTYYATLEAALAATGNEITLLTPYVVEAGKKVTIDLAGKTITQSVACTESYEMILNKGTLIIKDSVGGGKISFTDTSNGDPNFGWGSYTIRNEGTLVIEGGTIEHNGAQAFGTHMICAIFQYSGSTTINGGTISTPNYRSVRLWKGEMTINDGAFDGQVWVQAVDNSSKLTVNGGTFEPNGNDASSVFVSNATYDVAFAVTNGTFNGKIGCSDVTKLAGTISGGKFSEVAKNGTNTGLLVDNAIFKDNGNGYYGIVNSVVSVNGVGYSTLKEAIEKATADDTITFLADITENVTIDKSVIIDGANFSYTGKMTLEVNNAEITIQNVKFIKGHILSDKSARNDTTLKISNCEFDGQKAINHAMEIANLKQFIIEGSTIKNYKLSAVYVKSGHNHDVAINDTTIESIGSYAIRIASGEGLNLNGVTIKNVYGGILADTAKNYTFTNCTFENVTLPLTSWTYTLTGKFIFNETNTIPNLSTSSGGTFVLSAGATLTAPEGLAITTGVGYVVKYENDTYYTKKCVVEMSMKPANGLGIEFKVDAGSGATYAEITFDNDSEPIKIDVNADNSVFFDKLSAKQMSDEFTVTFKVENEIVAELTTSIADYVMAELETVEEGSAYETLLNAMLNYGVAAKKYFAEDINEEYTSTSKYVDCYYLTGATECYLGARVVGDSTLKLQFLFDFGDMSEAKPDVSITDLKGVELELVCEVAENTEKPGVYMVSIEIPAYCMSTAIVCKVTDGNSTVSITYSVESYAFEAFAFEDYYDRRELVDAMMAYGKAAVKYEIATNNGIKKG